MAHKTEHKPQERTTTSAWPLMRKVQWGTLILLVALAEIVFLSGQTVLSYAIDSIAVAAFFWIKKIRERDT